MIEEDFDTQTGFEPKIEEEKPDRSFVRIFLFPLNRTGLAHIGLITLLVFLLFLVRFGLYKLLGPIAMPVIWGLRLVNLLVGAEIIFYFIHCVRESGQGATQAPDSLLAGAHDTGGLMDLIQEFFACLIPVIFCFFPSILYAAFTEKHDWIFWVLLSAGTVYFPMFFLAVVMFDSTSGYNPLLHLISICRTLFSYSFLVLQFYLIILSFVLLVILFQRFWLGAVLLYPVQIYFLMVLMHLLGRFYYLKQDKLDWEV